MFLAPPGHNTKLGPLVVSWSRPVGVTCPPGCPFGESGLCYAGRLEKNDPAVAEAWKRNIDIDIDRFRGELSLAASRGYAVRGLVGGDFYRDGKLDVKYLEDLVRAFNTAVPRPIGWTYTHAWRDLGDRWRRVLECAGLRVLASVHSDEEAALARSYGYRLAIDGGEMPKNCPERLDARRYVCPEQRLGCDKVTCSSCGYCFNPSLGGDVVFYRHGPGLPNYRAGGKHIEK